MDTLQFAHIEYSIQTKSIDIFTIGCEGNCVDCCNPEIKDWSLRGMDSKQVILKVQKLIEQFDSLVDRVLLVGGDPADGYKRYPKEFIEFVQQLRLLDKPIYLFTRHSIDYLDEELISSVDYIKTGPYIPDLKCDDNIQYGIRLATSNQKIWKVDEL